MPLEIGISGNPIKGVRHDSSNNNGNISIIFYELLITYKYSTLISTDQWVNIEDQKWANTKAAWKYLGKFI